MGTQRLLKLQEQKKALEAKIRAQNLKLSAEERQRDTRRKILAGAAVLEKAANDNDFSIRLIAELNKFLVRDRDRALFSLPALPQAEETATRKPPTRATESRDLTHSSPELEEA